MELKECPFCGGSARVLPAEVYGYGDVYCENCGAQVVGFNTQEKSGKDMVGAFLEGAKRAEKYEKEMESELKPCPFCGGKARVHVEENYYDRPLEYYHNIYCIGCGAQMFVASRSEGVRKWNRRQNE